QNLRDRGAGAAVSVPVYMAQAHRAGDRQEAAGVKPEAACGGAWARAGEPTGGDGQSHPRSGEQLRAAQQRTDYAVGARLSRALFPDSQPLSLFAGGEFVNKLVKLAVNYAGQVVAAVVDAVVGNAVLRVIVGANLLRPVAAAHLPAPLAFL